MIRNTERLRGVNPELEKLVRDASGIVHLAVLEGLRDKDRQAELVKAGRSKTLNSKHIIGDAVDLAPLPIDWDNREPFFRLAGVMQALASVRGLALRWGGDWDRDGKTEWGEDDLVHFELVR
jgi:peptidoglycan L-alanyl-D-glutamate endopeptidase CwlK